MLFLLECQGRSYIVGVFVTEGGGGGGGGVEGGGGGGGGRWGGCGRGVGEGECRSLERGSGVILHQKIFKSGSIETLFSVLVMGYVSEKSASNMKMANHYDQNN